MAEEWPARLLEAVCVAGGLLVAVWLPTGYVMGLGLTNLAMAAPVLPASILAWLLVRRGRHRGSAWILVGVSWLSVAALASLSVGVSVPVFGAFTVVVFSAAILLGTQAAILLAVASFGLAALQVLGRDPVSVEGGGPLPLLMTQCMLLTASAALGGLASHRIHSTLRMARGHERELADRNRLLEESHEQFRSLVENASDLVTELDSNGCFSYASPAFRSQVGWDPEELIGHHPFEFTHPDDREEVRGAIQTALERKPVTCTSRFRARDGSWHLFESTANAMGSAGRSPRIVVVSRDISERVLLEEQVRKTQKLESLGILAGGIAHDFNNLLVGIQGNAEVALRELPQDGRAYRMVEDIERAGEVAAGLTRQLLAYAGKGNLRFEEFDVSELVQEMTQLLRSGVGSQVRLDFERDPVPAPMEGDASQIRQVVMNVITNAAESLGEGGGIARIRTGVHRVDREFLAHCAIAEGVEEGDYVFVDVQDRGVGIDPASLETIFDPFYTTKFQGRGLGLAAVLGIVRNHAGTLRVWSEPGQGTTFRVLLPRAAGGRREAVGDPRLAREPGTRAEGDVLVVDDEGIARDAVVRMLEKLGYRAAQAAGGREALEVFGAAPTRWGCVVLDLTMPEMDGETTFRALRKVRSDVPVLLVSGHSEEHVQARLRGKSRLGRLTKPFGVDDLGDALRRVMAEPDA